MTQRVNLDVAARLDEVAQLLELQGANPFRVQAYRGGAETVRRLERPVSDLLATGGLAALDGLPGIGPTLAGAIRDLVSLGRLPMLDRLRGESDAIAVLNSPEAPPSVIQLLSVDREYRTKAAAGTLPRIAPRRFNPARLAWLPVLHTHRKDHHYTALFSNTARAHELDRTRDWVVLYADGGHGEQQFTVVTARLGPLKGRRVVRGREAECFAHYRRRCRPMPGVIDSPA